MLVVFPCRQPHGRPSFCFGQNACRQFPLPAVIPVDPILALCLSPSNPACYLLLCCSALPEQDCRWPCHPSGAYNRPLYRFFPIQGAFRLWTIVHWTGSLVSTWRGVLLHPLIGRWHRSWTAPWQRDRPPRTRPRTGLASRRQGSSPPGRDSAVQRSPGTAGSLW